MNDTWPEASKKLKDAGLTKTGKVPVLEYKGNILTQVNKSAPTHQLHPAVF